MLKSNLRLDPYLIAERNIQNKFPNYNLNDFTKREFVFGYIGRICEKKGFYKALDLSEIITNNGYEILFDVLTLKEEGYLNQNSKVKMIFNNKKLNLPPKYNQIQYLILPYLSISTSICIPLVPLEAAIMGCRVILPKFMESLYLEILSNNVNIKDAFIFTEDYNLTIKKLSLKNNSQSNVSRAENAAELLGVLDNKNKFIVLRDSQGIINGTYRDIDLLSIDKSFKIKKVLNALSSSNIKIFRFIKRYKYYQIICFKEEWNKAIILDIWCGLRIKGCIYFDYVKLPLMNFKKFKNIKENY